MNEYTKRRLDTEEIDEEAELLHLDAMEKALTHMLYGVQQYLLESNIGVNTFMGASPRELVDIVKRTNEKD